MTRDDTPEPVAEMLPSARPRFLRVGVLMASIVASLLFFALTSPRRVPSVLLIVGFVVLGVLLFSGLRLLLVLSGLQQRLVPVQRTWLLLVGAVLPVLLLMLQSIGQLTVRDILTLGGLFLLGGFYFSRVIRPRP